MGRVSRYKKIKAADPFSKKSRNPTDVDVTHDRPPEEFFERRLQAKKRKRELDWDNENDREVLLHIDAKKQLKLMNDSQSGQSTKAQTPKLEGKRPDETMKQFMARIRQATRKTLAEQTKKLSSTAQKRKQFLNEKKKSKKLKKLGIKEQDSEERAYHNESDGEYKQGQYSSERKRPRKEDEFPEKETIRFGDVVHKPPDLSSFANKLEKTKLKQLSKVKQGSSPVQSLSTKKDTKRSFAAMTGDHSSDEYTTAEQSRANSRAQLSSAPSTGVTLKQEEMEKLRNQAQEAYKRLKAKRSAEAALAAAAAKKKK